MAREIQLQSPKTPPLPTSHPKSPEDNNNSPQTNPTTSPIRNPNRLTLIPLIFLIFFEVAGGPYGAEPAVSAAGPLFALLGFLIFPFIWSIPESLVTAELSTAIPGNGGFVLWASAAFGPFPGSLMGSWKFLSGVINSAAFPALCADYLARVVPAVANGPRRAIVVAVMNILLSFLNYTGLAVVGWSAVALGLAALAPFGIMAAAAAPKLRVSRWGVVAKEKDWRLFFNTLFWNLNFWDSASTMAGEVVRPETTFPRALVVAVAMTALGYLVPLAAAIGAIDAPPEAWGSGYFADAAGIIAGRWLKYWIEVGAVLSAIGLYEAQLSSCSFQLLGMADLGLLPRFFASRAKWFDTPWVGILVSSLITFSLSFMSFNDIISSANFLYSLGMLLEFAAFLWLRRKRPDLKRPYRVPLRLPGLVAMCFVPSAFLIFVMAIASWKVFVISAGFTLLGVGVYFLMGFCKSRGCLEFSNADHMEGEDKRGDDVDGREV
ncbi:probable polyamine transporter At3g13620 [Typha latifolia]|uniref:probable polyamine transporter At3g13620 n=1 Tax=Typha latifolia TaxID=4733 RepID=UPI003C2CAED9